MVELYEKIEALCKQNGTTITSMCRESGASRAPLSDLKMGRSKTLSTDTLTKIADYFNVSVDYLLGNAEKDITKGTHQVTDDDIKFALFGGDVSDETFEDVKRFAAFIKKEKENKKG